MLKNSKTAYGLIAILIHWLMAITIFFMFGLGLYMVELTYYDSWYKGSLDLHKSLGLTLFFVYLIRVIWRFINVSPEPPLKPKGSKPGPKWEHQAAHFMHMGLYIMLLLLFITGYLISTADGRGIAIFGFFDIPGFGSFIDNQEDLAGDVHEILAFTLIAMVVLHALAALKHQFIDKDGILMRMIKPHKDTY